MGDGPDEWRTEADDEWLASHSGGVMIRLGRFAGGGLADGVSNSAAAGLLGSTPRHPPLKVRDGQAEQIRYAEGQYAYTTVATRQQYCPRCGGPTAEQVGLERVTEDGEHQVTGSLCRCRECDADSFMFRSWMPRALARARLRRRIVL